jgi:hypothetical protein
MKTYISPETLKPLEENIGGKLLIIGLDNKVLDMIPKVEATKVKINKYDCITLKSFYTAKETTK